MNGHVAGIAKGSLVGARTYALLTDGSTVEIRPAHPGDAEDVRAMHAAMSPDNLYLRFFSLSPLNAEREAERVCRQPGPDHDIRWRIGHFGVITAVAAFTAGEPWLDRLLATLDRRRALLATLLRERLPMLS